MNAPVELGVYARVAANQALIAVLRTNALRDAKLERRSAVRVGHVSVRLRSARGLGKNVVRRRDAVKLSVKVDADASAVKDASKGATAVSRTDAVVHEK